MQAFLHFVLTIENVRVNPHYSLEFMNNDENRRFCQG